jgi:hypothetical protein
MKDIKGRNYYSPIEEKIHIISHAIGFLTRNYTYVEKSHNLFS